MKIEQKKNKWCKGSTHNIFFPNPKPRQNKQRGLDFIEKQSETYFSLSGLYGGFIYIQLHKWLHPQWGGPAVISTTINLVSPSDSSKCCAGFLLVQVL